MASLLIHPPLLWRMYYGYRLAAEAWVRDGGDPTVDVDLLVRAMRQAVEAFLGERLGVGVSLALGEFVVPDELYPLNLDDDDLFLEADYVAGRALEENYRRQIEDKETV